MGLQDSICAGLEHGMDVASVANDSKNAPQISSSDSPMVVLIWGAALLGGIAAFIAWGMTHAYPGG